MENRIRPELQDDMKALKADLEKIQQDLRGVAQTLMGLGRDSAKLARKGASTRVESGMELLEQYAKERPVATVLTALAIGAIVGKIL